MGGMAKAKLNVHADVDLMDRFREQAQHYGGRLGLCSSAALLQWVESDPEVQAEYIRRVFDAELRDEMQSLVEAAKREQVARIEQRERKKRK